MSVQDIDIPEVQPMHQNARFFKDGEIDFVEISFVGSKDTVIKRVAPEHMAKYRDAWTSYCDGSPLKKRDGTLLTAIGMNEQVAERYVQQNVHTAEEIAALSDAQCQALGHGTLTFRNTARDMLETQKAQQMDIITKRIGEAAASVKAMPAEVADAKYASKEDVEALNSKMDAILAALMQKKKPGRPPKAREE